MSRSSRPTPPATVSAAVIAGFTLQQAKARTRSHPQDALAWKSLGYHQYRNGEIDQGRANLQRSLALDDQDADTHAMLGLLEQHQGDDELARNHFSRALKLSPNSTEANLGMSDVHAKAGGYDQAMACLDRLSPEAADGLPALTRRGPLLFSKHRYDEAEQLFRKLTERQPRQAEHWNSLGNALRALGRLKEAYTCYDKASALLPTDPVPRSNYLTSLHYDPTASIDTILKASQNWGAMFAPAKPAVRPSPIDKSAQRVLRVGMISDGFRQHPVGAMTTTALVLLNRYGIELHAYTTSSVVDAITKRIMSACASWQSISHMSDEALAQRIRDDDIDILIDLSGHNTGTRMRALTLEPAPVLVKWVGGLIGTTGVKAIDYLITDRIESPLGSDAQYTEKLIRMPDDYICYLPPADVPAVGPLPALRNGYITFGCFNNPTKINSALLAEWARLMHQVPNSRLLLKGGQFESEYLCDQITRILTGHGIDASRIRMEGHSRHLDLLATYNEVDVALDPWPYSGGLTTCEAMLMGVPVVTLPGPTFAGRHSATHLVNAGMPELVADDWDTYRKRVLELVHDLDSLATIRSHLRDVLLHSPVCDATRFSGNLANALRAIWARYCEGKTPAALVLGEGQAWFEDEEAPRTPQHPDPGTTANASEFNFTFEGRIVTLDHGGLLIGSESFPSLNKLGTLTTVVIDPANRLQDISSLKAEGDLHHHAHLALGDGEKAILHACLDDSLSGTLEPLPSPQLLPAFRQGAKVLAKLPIQTIRLDDVQGLSRVDWLILDDTHDALRIIEGGRQVLDSLLFAQIRIAFHPLHRGQVSLDAVGRALGVHGMRLLRLNTPKHSSYLTQTASIMDPPAAQLLSADALYIPDEQKLAGLSQNQRLKLAFLAHTMVGAADYASTVLDTIEPGMAHRYLRAGRWMTPASTARATASSTAAAVIHAPALLRSTQLHTHTAVGVPLYNEENYVEQTIRSLLSQDIDDVRFLIADNASTDDTLAIVRDLVGKDARFDVFQQESNTGAFHNFKFVLEQTRSDYFMWLGGHDRLSSNYIREVTQRLDEDARVSMAFGMPYSELEGDIGFMRAAVYDFSAKAPLKRYLGSVAELANCTIVHSLFRRNHINDLALRQVISGDHVFISHLLWKGHLSYVQEAKYFRRIFKTRSDSASERITGKKIELQRAPFYDFYREDLDALAAGVLTQDELAKAQAWMRQTLLKRFGP
ncbi:TPR domain protein, putative component of TonB system [plant metagenome]|uniref:protein O-GlcNAc transferase n=1 Tax=plant metagenome TaxID=1297885 RepID=A0A484UK60_9ZZZZ